MSGMIYKKDYAIKAKKVKLIESHVLGRSYVEDLSYA